MSVDALQYICREAGQLAGLKVTVFPHMLRHSASYSLTNDGLDTRLIQEFLGYPSTALHSDCPGMADGRANFRKQEEQMIYTSEASTRAHPGSRFQCCAGFPSQKRNSIARPS
jgi:Phage integrase family